MSTAPRPITLIFSPDFGAVHFWPDGSSQYHRDEHLCGRIIPIRPLPGDSISTSIIEIGRHPECRIRINRAGLTDSLNYDLFNIFSRKHCTLAWADCSLPGYSWLSESKWLVLPGGVFVKDGHRESCAPSNGVWLNGRKLRINDNPEPLFEPGQNFAKLCLALTGKILIVDGILDENTTGYPDSVWEGEGWPLPRTQEIPDQARLGTENEIVQAMPTPVIVPQPWYVAAILEPAWQWFQTKNTPTQIIILILVGVLSAVLLYLWFSL